MVENNVFRISNGRLILRNREVSKLSPEVVYYADNRTKENNISRDKKVSKNYKCSDNEQLNNYYVMHEDIKREKEKDEDIFHVVKM